MDATRQRIRTHIADNPGVHFNAIGRQLDLATGQTQYHLRQLSRAGVVNSLSVVGQKHYYLPEFDPWEQRALAFFRRETTRDILCTLLESGDMSAVELTESVGIARSTLSWHLSNLVEADLVVTSVTNGHTHIECCQPSQLAVLAELVSPSRTARLVDRFERLVDDTLSGC